jgi:hypothetical protein
MGNTTLWVELPGRVKGMTTYRGQICWLDGSEWQRLNKLNHYPCPPLGEEL